MYPLIPANEIVGRITRTGTDVGKFEVGDLDKWSAFGWHVIHCYGNDIPQIFRAFTEALTTWHKPAGVIVSTLMGKGIRAIEGEHFSENPGGRH